MSVIIKIIDQRETQKQKKTKTSKDRKEQGGTEAIVEGCELNDFVAYLS